MTKKKVKKKKKEEIKLDIPVDVENEQYILACVLNWKNLQRSFLEIEPGDFLVANHVTIAWCIQECIHLGREVTPEMLHIVVNDYDGEKKFTGLKYIYELKSSQEKEPSLDNYEKHLSKLRSDSIKSNLNYGKIDEIIEKIRNPRTPVDQILNSIQDASNFIEERNIVSESDIIRVSDIDESHREIAKEREQGLLFKTCGYRNIDKYLTEGFAPQRISIVAGRPGMCKSALVDNFLYRLGVAKIPSVLFSLEMDRYGTYDRFLSIASRLPLKLLVKERKEMTDDDREKENRARSFLRKFPIYVYDKPSPSLSTISKKIKHMVEKFGVQVVFIDLFDRVARPENFKNRNTADELAHMLRLLQVIARECNVHICNVVQINRKAEYRKSKRPEISDLKDSGVYEEVADLIMLLYRESYYLKEQERIDYFNTTGGKDVLNLHIAKQRQGEMNVVVKLEFEQETTKVLPLEEDR